MIYPSRFILSLFSRISMLLQGDLVLMPAVPLCATIQISHLNKKLHRSQRLRLERDSTVGRAFDLHATQVQSP